MELSSPHNFKMGNKSQLVDDFHCMMKFCSSFRFNVCGNQQSGIGKDTLACFQCLGCHLLVLSRVTSTQLISGEDWSEEWLQDSSSGASRMHLEGILHQKVV